MSKRVENINLTRQLKVSSISYKLPSEVTDCTHHWKLSITTNSNPDFIEKVVFTLHETFTNPIRIATLQDNEFQVNELGWGEFHAYIKVHFVDPQERPIGLTHYVKLHDVDKKKEQQTEEYYSEMKAKGVIYDQHINLFKENVPKVYNVRVDTLVFRSPTEKMYRMLKNDEVVNEDEEEGERIEKATKWVLSQIQNKKENLN